MSPEEMDREATAFAIELLMPEFLLRPMLKGLSFDIDDDKVIKALARKFRVSPQLMALRVGQMIERPRRRTPPLTPDR